MEEEQACRGEKGSCLHVWKSESIKVEYYVFQRQSSFPTYEYG
uniref:Histocompatibility minor HB-1 n=1 Tax=Rhinolophus ferrumequinum TaxID=59479 RepID=A0A671EG38_RHIFE